VNLVIGAVPERPARVQAWSSAAGGLGTSARKRRDWFKADSQHNNQHGLARSLSVDEASVPAVRRFVVLWLLLAAISMIIFVVPDLPIAVHEPHFSSAVGAVSGVIGLALMQLGVLRFRLLRRTLDLHAALAFGVLALGNLFAVWACPPTENGDLAVEVSLYILLLSRVTAAALFLTGIASTATAVRSSGLASIVLVPLTVSAALGVSTVVAMREQLPVLLDAGAHDFLDSGRSIPDFLHGQAAGLIAANSITAAALCLAAIGYAVVGRRLLDPYISALGAGLALLFFGQLHAILFPSFASDYLTTGDAFRLVAYGLLVSNLVWRTATDLADRTSRDERLRLSRELHDGLAQQLALLGLRLAHAAERPSLSDASSHDLHIAQRLVESASLEARQAIAALRTDRVTCDALDQALTAFADEFSQNHDVEVRVETESTLGVATIDGLLQAELLRILHEACSNAIRHGRATRIPVCLAVTPHALRLVIRDNGRGFEPTAPANGLGLRSMAERVERRGGQLVIESAHGQGTCIAVCLPLGAAAGR
jgi:signal transduction histidine kinase